MTPGMVCCTSSKSPWEARPLAQVVVFNMDLKICLLPEVPGTGCAAKQLLLIAVLHCQMHLNGRGGMKKQSEVVYFTISFFILQPKCSCACTDASILCKKEKENYYYPNEDDVSLTCMETLESKTS